MVNQSPVILEAPKRIASWPEIARLISSNQAENITIAYISLRALNVSKEQSLYSVFSKTGKTVGAFFKVPGLVEVFPGYTFADYNGNWSSNISTVVEVRGEIVAKEILSFMEYIWDESTENLPSNQFAKVGLRRAARYLVNRFGDCLI